MRERGGNDGEKREQVEEGRQNPSTFVGKQSIYQNVILGTSTTSGGFFFLSFPLKTRQSLHFFFR